jgi:hypothetical protein
MGARGQGLAQRVGPKALKTKKANPCCAGMGQGLARGGLGLCCKTLNQQPKTNYKKLCDYKITIQIFTKFINLVFVCV